MTNETQPQAEGASAKILVIDDESSFREIIARALAKQGFAVVEAAAGKEGLRKALDSVPDLVLCDLLMPGMNGYEELAALRREQTLAGIPFIVLTGESAPVQLPRGMNLGADDYLTKPVGIPCSPATL